MKKITSQFANSIAWIQAFAGMTNGGWDRHRRIGGDGTELATGGFDDGETENDDSDSAVSAAGMFPHSIPKHRSAPSPHGGEGWGEGGAMDTECDAKSYLQYDLHLSSLHDLESALPDSLHVREIASGAHHRPWRNFRHAGCHQVQRLGARRGIKSQRCKDQLALAAEIYNQPNSVRASVTKAAVQHRSAVVARHAHIWLSLPLSPHPALLRRSTLSRKGRGKGNRHAQTH
jgi:hypothetical protein